MFTIGLTGGIGTGKSTVADLFRKRNVPVIDFDGLTHEAQEPGMPVWEKIVDVFGRDILDRENRIDRGKLGSIVFSDETLRRRLNDIVHPALFEEWRRRHETIAMDDPNALVVSEVPLLVEGNLQGLFDMTVLVWSSPDRQIERVMARNNLNREDVMARLEAQMAIDEKTNHVDYVIDNNGSMEETERHFDELWQTIMTLKEAKQ